jgi:chromosome partitioning protein
MTGALRQWFTNRARPHVIVVGNEKGGTGKSTVAMHLVVGLLKRGYSVGTIDLDGHQATLSHYIQNRERLAAATNSELEMSEHRRLRRSRHRAAAKAEEKETAEMASALEGLRGKDYIVVDTPGSDGFLTRLAHILADTLITPLNDSFLDLDVLVRVNLQGERILGPSVYSEMVANARTRRLSFGGTPVDWIVMRNRLSHLHTHNNRRVGQLLEQLAPRLGFRLVRGFGERVIFRELFANGLTLLDLPDSPKWWPSRKSHATACREIWALLDAVGLSEASDTGAISRSA